MNKIDVKEYLKDPDQAYLQKLVHDLYEDDKTRKEIERLSLSEEAVRANAAKLTDYLEDQRACRQCPGLLRCPKTSRCLQARLTYEDGHLSIAYSPCDVLLESLRLSSLYLYADFPSAWRSATLKDLDLSENRRPLLKEYSEILNGTSHRWLYLYGNRGVGKSYLLVVFANMFAGRDLGRVAVINARRRLDELADLSYKNKERFKEMFDALITVPLLIIDDLGSETKNDYRRDSILLPLLEERAKARRLTFFSSTFHLKEIEVLYASGKTPASLLMAKRLYALLKEEAGREFDLTGASFYR